MTQPAKVQEPSMEEILASIRRIIADDEAKPADEIAAVGTGLSMPVLETPQPRVESPPSRIHNIAAVTPHPAASQSGQSRGDKQPMAASVEKSVSAPSASMFGNGTPGTGATASASPIPPVQDEADVFDLTDEMALPSSTPSFRTVEPKDDLVFVEPPPVVERRDPPRTAAPQPRAPEPQPLADDILSKHTASAVESAFNSLASTVLSANSRTLEDLVKEMMRPMLKNWLDDNLPGLVERIVKTEIERVARGR